MKCWICKNEASTSEHKFKASDLRRLYGKNFKVKINLISGDHAFKLQGPKDKKLLHDIPICANCNNNLTSSHDKSYDKLIRSIDGEFLELEKNKFIDLKKVYEGNWEVELRNLYKYYAKQIGCRVAQIKGINYAKSLSEFIQDDITPRSFKLLFYIKKGVYVWDLHSKKTYGDGISLLYNGSSQTYTSNDLKEFIHGWSSYGWFTVHWIYSEGDLNQKLLNPNQGIMPVILEEYNFDGFKEEESIMEWFQQSGIETNEKRIKFINKLIKS